MNNRIDRFIPDFLLSSRMRPWRHVLLQTVLFFITINVFWDAPNAFIIQADRVWAWLIYWGVMNVVIYTNLYLLTPRLLMSNRLFAYLFGVVALIVFCLASIGFMEAYLVEVPDGEPEGNSLPVWLNLLSSVLTVSLLIFGTSAIQIFRRWLADSRRAADLQAETLRSELSFLKNQINPHFLFNMLNNAYLLVKKRRPEAPGILFKLEDLLRYQFNDSTREAVPLVSDIRFLSDFLNLEKVRRDRFDFRISKEGGIDRVLLPPLLFIPFVENAVKHNNDSERESYVHLGFRVEGDTLRFRCENSKPAVPAAKGDVGGIGLANIRRRLELLYSGRHILNITETEQTYAVDLQLEL